MLHYKAVVDFVHFGGFKELAQFTEQEVESIELDGCSILCGKCAGAHTILLCSSKAGKCCFPMKFPELN